MLDCGRDVKSITEKTWNTDSGIGQDSTMRDFALLRQREE